MSNVVFVGNVPYNMGEEQLIEVFKSVGQVIGFRLVFDRDTGKAKGYGFCEFADHETALSAVRNLNNTDVGGRPLRIDLADSDPFLEGKTTVRGEILDGGYPGPAEPRSGWRNAGLGRKDDSFLSRLPTGKPTAPGMSALDAISQSLAAMPPPQILEVLAQMKAFIITNPDQAKIMLQKHPQLSYALFQALVLHNIVPAEVILKMHSGTSTAPSGPPHPPSQTPLNRPPLHIQQQQQQQQQHAPPFAPQHGMPPFPPGQSGPPQSMMPSPGSAPSGYPPLGGYYRGPAPQQQPVPPTPPTPAVAATTAGIDDSQREMIMLVLGMSQEAINALPEAQRVSIMQLRTQFMSLAPQT